MVLGGFDPDFSVFLDSTEIFSYRDNVWNTLAEKLPSKISGVRATTINNRILIFGNYDHFCIVMFLIIIQVGII